MLHYEELSVAVLREWGIEPGDPDPDEMIADGAGYALRGEDGVLLAIGGVRLVSVETIARQPDDEYRPLAAHLAARFEPYQHIAVGWFRARFERLGDGPGARSWWVHRIARLFLAALARAGQTEVWAIADPTVPRAEAWLARLGFAPLEHGVWRLGLSRSSSALRGRGRDAPLGRHERLRQAL